MAGQTYENFLTEISLLSIADPSGARPILSIAGNGTVVTVTCLAKVPFQVGANVTIDFVTPSDYNGTYSIISSTNSGGITTVQFSSTSVIAYVSGGLIGTDPNLLAYIPRAIAESELRILRDLDMLNTLTSSNVSLSTTANQQTVSIPENTFITIRSVQIDVVVNLQTLRLPLRIVSEEYLNNSWNIGTDVGTPNYFSVYGGDTTVSTTTPFLILLGPIPDQAYNLLVRGTVRPPTLFDLGQTNPLAMTFISAHLFDLMIMACMVNLSGYQRNWGRQSDDPSMAISYENQYKVLLASAMGEESRKKFESSGWTSQSAPINASPNRGT
jgi:hypothetical protein